MTIPFRLNFANPGFTVKLFEYSHRREIGDSLVQIAGAPSEAPFQPTLARMK
jgi:hypothetical protein